ncbi:MAG TPA: response regulator [Polyangiales bacterium]|nr:response regulator [Polyangiales bacterium]
MAAKKILIADDSRTFRAVEEELLKRKGYTLLLAENGAQAVQIAVRELPDVILMDLQMPVMDGAKALAVLQSNEKTAAVPVVMVTTVSEDAQRDQLLAAGAKRVLFKPISGPDLLGAIREMLGEQP